MDTIKVGDKVKVVKTMYLHHSVRVGDTFEVTGIGNNSIEMKNKHLTQKTYLPDGEVVKVEPRPKYVEPEYIRKVKERVKSLLLPMLVAKRNYKRKDKYNQKNGYLDPVSPYLKLKSELNYCYTILRQHNELKKMYAKIKD